MCWKKLHDYCVNNKIVSCEERARDNEDGGPHHVGGEVECDREERVGDEEKQ